MKSREMICRRIAGTVAGVALLCGLLACGGVQQAKQAFQATQDLTSLGVSYHQYADAHQGIGPPDADEWLKWAKTVPAQTGNLPLIEQCRPGGKYTFVWGVNIHKLGATTSAYVLAHENKLPGATGVVLIADGSVKAMQPAEFNAAKKAPKNDGKDR